MKIKKAGWPRPRLPHQNEGRVGQSWMEKKVKKEGEDCFGNKKTFLVEDGHFLCHCGSVVRLDKNGFAACENCGEIFNDRGHEPQMSNRQKKLSLERFKYMCSQIVP